MARFGGRAEEKRGVEEWFERSEGEERARWVGIEKNGWRFVSRVARAPQVSP